MQWPKQEASRDYAWVSIDGQLRKIMVVIKMRGGNHAKDIREYEITSKGVVILGKRLTNYQGLISLSGPHQWNSRSLRPARLDGRAFAGHGNRAQDPTENRRSRSPGQLRTRFAARCFRAWSSSFLGAPAPFTMSSAAICPQSSSWESQMTWQAHVRSDKS